MEVMPYLSVGNLLFDDSRIKIREKLNLTFVQGTRGEADDDIQEFYDYFETLELFIYFDNENKLWAFEFFKTGPTFN